AMNMLYESIVKRGSLMVVPSGLADSLNVPNLLGLTGAGANLAASLQDELEGTNADAAEG
ncbi:MAG: slipin family protein, partial [Acidimicrobiia bacterium]